MPGNYSLGRSGCGSQGPFLSTTLLRPSSHPFLRLSHPVLPLIPSLSQISTSGPNPWSKPRLAESKTILYQFTQIFLSCYSKVRPDRLVPFPQSTPKHPCLFISKSHNSTFPHEMLQFRPETVSAFSLLPRWSQLPSPSQSPPSPAGSSLTAHQPLPLSSRHLAPAWVGAQQWQSASHLPPTASQLL